MFVWNAIAHMALPLGEAGIRQIEHEDAMLAAMRADMPEHGLYMFPNMPPGMTETQYGQKLASGPSGLMVYYPRREFSFGASMLIEFLTELIEATVAAYLAWRIKAGSFGGRVAIYAVVGLAAIVSTNISYANWYGFPLTYTAGYMFTIWMGYVCAGLAGAAMKIGAPGVRAASA